MSYFERDPFSHAPTTLPNPIPLNASLPREIALTPRIAEILFRTIAESPVSARVFFVPIPMREAAPPTALPDDAAHPGIGASPPSIPLVVAAPSTPRQATATSSFTISSEISPKIISESPSSSLNPRETGLPPKASIDVSSPFHAPQKEAAAVNSSGLKETTQPQVLAKEVNQETPSETTQESPNNLLREKESSFLLQEGSATTQQTSQRALTESSPFQQQLANSSSRDLQQSPSPAAASPTPPSSVWLRTSAQNSLSLAQGPEKIVQSALLGEKTLQFLRHLMPEISLQQYATTLIQLFAKGVPPTTALVEWLVSTVGMNPQQAADLVQVLLKTLLNEQPRLTITATLTGPLPLTLPAKMDRSLFALRARRSEKRRFNPEDEESREEDDQESAL